MKRKFISSILLIALAFPCVAESPEYNNEFRLGYGRVSIPGFAMVMGSVLGSAFAVSITGDSNNSISANSIGATSFGYYRHINRHIAVGSEITYELISMTSNSDGSKQYTNFINLMPGAKFEWFNHDHFGMYSKLNFGGGCNISDGDPSFNLAFQASPICFEAGGKKLRGFAEIGFGFDGLLAAGVSYRF